MAHAMVYLCPGILLLILWAIIYMNGGRPIFCVISRFWPGALAVCYPPKDHYFVFGYANQSFKFRMKSMKSGILSIRRLSTQYFGRFTFPVSFLALPPETLSP